MADDGRVSIIVAGFLAVGAVCSAGWFLAFHGAGVAEAGSRYADMELIDQNGVQQRLSSWSGRAVVLDFIFTGCGDVCPLKTAQLADVQQSLDPALRERVEFVSVSIDPEHDDPAALRAYAERNGAQLTDWSFLTGKLGEVANFAAAFDPGPLVGDGAPSHIITVRLLDGSGKVVRRYVAEPVDKARLLQDIVAVAAEPTAEPPLAPTEHHASSAEMPPKAPAFTVR